MTDAPLSAGPAAANPFAQARFILSAARLAQLPADELPELAFVGRSNAGKSSALNVICQKKGLARVSKTPGRTQLINLFDLPGARLVDLPGYGFAAVPLSVKQDWGKLIGGYLASRDNLKLLVVVMDSRHPLTSLDEQMLDWCASAGRDCHVLLTKADKLARGPAAATLLQVQKALPRWNAGFTAQLFSSLKQTGVAEARATISARMAVLAAVNTQSD
jgi:GTP-binding protein